MHYEKHRSKGGSCKAGIKRAAAVLILAAFVFFSVNLQFRRVLGEIAENRAQNIFTESIANALGSIAEAGDSFDVVEIGVSDTGEIVSVSTDTGRVNALKAAISEQILKELKLQQEEAFTVSAGTLTGIDFLSGTGPEISVRMELRGSVVTDIVSELTEAGINQSLHTVKCTVKAEYTLWLPGYSFNTVLTNSIPLAESVIIGKVPDSYTYVVGDQNDTIGRIFDYGAQ